DDSLRLELCAGRSAAVVASSTPDYQRVDGGLRHLVVGPFISKSSPVDDPGHHTGFRDWNDDCFNEAPSYQLKSPQRAFLPLGAGNRRGLRNICCAGLAKDPRD